MNNEIKKILSKIEELGWNVSDEGHGEYMLSKYSPAGQDFSIIVDAGKDGSEFIDNIYDRYESYDPSEEASYWLDGTGHGKNGAPYDMRDLLDDMEACEQMILELFEALEDYDYYD